MNMKAGTRVARAASTRRRPTPNPPQATPILFICVHPCKNPKHPSNPTNRSRCMRYCRNGHRRRPRGTGAEDGKRSSSVLTPPPAPRQHRTGLPHPPSWSGLTRPSRANRATPERFRRPIGFLRRWARIRRGAPNRHGVRPPHRCRQANRLNVAIRSPRHPRPCAGDQDRHNFAKTCRNWSSARGRG